MSRHPSGRWYTGAPRMAREKAHWAYPVMESQARDRVILAAIVVEREGNHRAAMAELDAAVLALREFEVPDGA